MSAGIGSETERIYVTFGAWLTYHDRKRYREICVALSVDDFCVDLRLDTNVGLQVRRGNNAAASHLSWPGLKSSDPGLLMLELQRLADLVNDGSRTT